MRTIVKGPVMIAWVGMACAALACQLGGAADTQDLQEETPTSPAVDTAPLMKPTPTLGDTPIETKVPTSVPTQAPPGGQGSPASAEVTSMTYYLSADKVFHVIGTIVNSGELPIWSLEVRYEILDQSGVVMDTVTGYPGYQLLFPGELTPFEADFVDPFSREVGDVRITLAGEAMSAEGVSRNSYLSSITHAFEVVRVEGRTPAVGDYEIVGEVKNVSGKSVTDVGISVMLFDARDNLLGVYVNIVPDKYVIGQGILLSPGETTTFDAWFGTLAEGGDVARIEVGVDGVMTE